jgi:adenine-specific DNA-methyltransferase
LVQLPEIIDEKTEAFNAGYNNICEIGKDRIRRAAERIKEKKKSENEKSNKELDFGNEIKFEIDYGFRVYKLDSSNMQDVYYAPNQYEQGQLDLLSDNIKPDRTSDDLVAQIMLDWGLPLSLKIEKTKIANKEVFKVADDALLCCFDEGIDEAFAKEIATLKPLRIVFRDKSFKDDTAKENVKQLLKQLSPDSEMKVI